MRMKKFFICCIAVSLLLAALPVTQVQALSLQKGFDVSSKNGVVDWEMVAESDMDFVMLRTGEGQAPDVDAQFEANYEGAKAAGYTPMIYSSSSYLKDDFDWSKLKGYRVLSV